MSRRLRAIGAVAKIAILDGLRRKDLYVMVILCGLMVGAGRLFAAFGVWGLETFLKDVTFTAVSGCSVLLCIMLAARQVPEEISRRTLYPLLARPIGRGELLLGKLLGTLIMAWAALLLAVAVSLLSLVSLHVKLGPIVIQYVLLRALSLAPIAALSLCLSLYMTPPAAILNTALVTFGAATFARASTLVGRDTSAPLRALMHVLDWVVPRFDLFDLGKKAAYGWPPIPAWVFGVMALYALIYTAAPFTLATIRFRRMAL